MSSPLELPEKKVGAPKKGRYDHLYEIADSFYELHAEDPILPYIKWDAPVCPPLDQIDGYNNHPKDQKFVHQRTPYKLEELGEMKLSDIKNVSAERDRPLKIGEMWAEISNNQIYYKDEVEWIKIQWRRRVYGYWFFNHGKPTYIDGNHYVYLNFWKIKSTRYDNLPEYRYRDMLFFNFLRFCKDDPDSFGAIYPKYRREGATSKAGCDGFCEVTNGFYRHMGIQSMDESHASEVFEEKVVEPWKTMPFFFKPLYKGSNDPKKNLTFKPTARNIAGSLGSTDLGLQGLIDFKAAGEKQYDGKQQYYYYHDEIGKDGDGQKIDYYIRWMVVKQTMAEGGEIKGFGLGTTTVDDMTASGARSFQKLCKASMYDQRDKNNRTRSGCYVFFIPSYVNLKGFTDEYGNPIIDDPDIPVKNDLGKYVSIGARTYLQQGFQGFEEAKDWDGLNENKRQFPMEYRDVFRRTSSHSGFDVATLNDRITEIMQEGVDKFIRRGNFYWEGDRFTSRVRWRDDERGKFYVSQLLPELESGQRHDSLKYWDEDMKTFYPTNSGEFVSASDPFKFEQTEWGKRSKGGFAVYRKHNNTIDDENVARHLWQTNQFVCTYNNLCDSKEEYAEDCLMASIYYNSLHLTESNITYILDKWIEWGFAGYLIKMMDKTSGKLKKNAGRSTQMGANKQELFLEMQSYIKQSGKYEKMIELLEECAEIEGPTDMTNFDLFTAGALCLVAAKTIYHEIVALQHESVDATGYVQEYEYPD